MNLSTCEHTHTFINDSIHVWHSTFCFLFCLLCQNKVAVIIQHFSYMSIIYSPRSVSSSVHVPLFLVHVCHLHLKTFMRQWNLSSGQNVFFICLFICHIYKYVYTKKVRMNIHIYMHIYKHVHACIQKISSCATALSPCITTNSFILRNKFQSSHKAYYAFLKMLKE